MGSKRGKGSGELVRAVDAGANSQTDSIVSTVVSLAMSLFRRLHSFRKLVSGSKNLIGFSGPFCLRVSNTDTNSYYRLLHPRAFEEARPQATYKLRKAITYEVIDCVILMLRVLCVAEKNDVAKGVAAILSKGQMTRREGRSVYNKIYTLSGEILGQNSTLSVTSVSGHLMEDCFGPDMKNWATVPIRSLFDAPVYRYVPEGMKDIAKTLVEESVKCDVLVIWTDCDREGEGIAAEIANVCSQSNPCIDVYRARFSEITPGAIDYASKHLTRLDQRIVDAVQCRSELDLRIGAAFTRLQTLHLRQKFPHILNVDGKQVVSYGSCQFPTLGFVVERYKAIERFISETYWKLVVDHRKGNLKAEFTWDRIRLFDQDIVQILHDDCVEAGNGKVESVFRKPKSKYRPQALDTVELEKLAARKLKMSAKYAMDIAEKLYRKGYISYPRTETNKFPPNINLSSLVNDLTSSAQWGDFANEVLERRPNPRNGTKTDEAHPPIHPLKQVADGSLKGDDWKVYELVVRHFLACLSWDAEGQETRVGLRIGGETFHATGLFIEDMGYLRVYPYERWSDKALPMYTEGEQLHDLKLRIANGETQPPELLNEGDLISLMDKFGIGTDATHAEHIEKIKTRQYAGVRDDGRFIPGYLGLALVEGYDAMGYALSKPQLRANLELQLQAICAGQRTKQEVLDEQLEKYKRIFIKTEERVNLLSEALTRYLNMSNSALVNTNRPTSGSRGAATRDGRQGARGGGAQGSGRNCGNLTTRARNTCGQNRRSSDSLGGLSSSNAVSAGQTATGMVSTMKQCDCGLPLIQKTVQKDGNNKGRKFWCCSKPVGQSDKCNYFEWAG